MRVASSRFFCKQNLHTLESCGFEVLMKSFSPKICHLSPKSSYFTGNQYNIVVADKVFLRLSVTFLGISYTKNVIFDLFFAQKQ